MPRVFTRVLTFKVEGEIYDNETKPEEILRNYNWRFRDYGDGKDRFYIEAEHKDLRGRVTKVTKLPKIHRYKTPDTEFFLV